jgi:hypothetical protein
MTSTNQCKNAIYLSNLKFSNPVDESADYPVRSLPFYFVSDISVHGKRQR